MEPQHGDTPSEGVPVHFYREFLTYAAEVEYLKAEVANLRAGHDKEPAPTKVRRRKKGRNKRLAK
jgi:hypothetical protein